MTGATNFHDSQGGLTMLRTDNSPTGKPFGGWGLYFVQDDVAKIGRLLNNSGGMIDDIYTHAINKDKLVAQNQVMEAMMKPGLVN
jgi:hypothetical protein